MDELVAAIRDLLPLERVVRVGGVVIGEILVAWVAYLLVRRAIKAATRAANARMADEVQRQRATTLLLLAGSVAKYVIIFFFGLMVLRDLGVNAYPVLAGAGVLGLAVGFGAQNLVRDVVSGFFIIMEGQYAVGDLVEINGAFGRVVEVGLRITKLRDPNGEIRHFPNGSISTANNYTEGHIPYLVTVPFSGEGPADPGSLVRQALTDFDREFRVFAEAPSLGSFEELHTYARVLPAEVRVVPGRQSIVEQKLPARLAGALERAGHPMPEGTDVGLALHPSSSGSRS